MKSALFLILLTLGANAEIIRLSLVAPEATPGYTRHEYGEGEEKNVIFVEDKGFLSEADIALATPSPQSSDAVNVTLSPQGTEKMIAATTPMRPGIDRIAIMVDGKILSAPVVQSVPLGKNFVINGLKGEDEPAKLAARLMGKTEEEFKSDLAKKKERIANLPKPPPPDYHNDEEYGQLVAERERVGLYYMDRNYTEEDLKKLLSPGMILADVTGIFGKANRVSSKDNGNWEMTFETAPEKFPLEEKFHLDSFIAVFSDGKLVSWHPFGSSRMPRAPKPPKSEANSTNLNIKIPAADMSSEGFNMIEFLEGHEISLKPGETSPTDADFHTLISTLWMLAEAADETESLDPQCDWFSLVAGKLPELAEISKKFRGKKVPVSSLKAPLKPYVYGGKPLP